MNKNRLYLSFTVSVNKSEQKTYYNQLKKDYGITIFEETKSVRGTQKARGAKRQKLELGL